MNVRAAIAALLGALAFACGAHHHDDGGTATQSVASACSDDDTDSAPLDLACTGLYASGTSGPLAPSVRTYAPSTPFWSDGAEKQRYLSLPGNEQIDTRDPNAWVFPVGTKAWKDLTVKGKRIETRFFWKMREGKWVKATYVWSEDGAHAKRVDTGVKNALGTGFDIPTSKDCDGCHEGKHDRLLGVEAVSLGAPGASGLTLASLAAEGRLTKPFAASQLDLGEGTRARAVGWLHVNCGVTCHNGSANATGNATGLRLRLEVDGAGRVSADALLQTTLGVAATMPQYEGDVRIAPGAPEKSLLVMLASSRGGDQMPPIATALVDEAGMAAVTEWIRGLTPPTSLSTTTQ